ncbi:MAG: hypothetical protein PHH09_04950 [Methanoregulaceae archaeon]|nr:hypothetical protein [Methanolinea sp.]MDD5048258.1 hypothetical protein [Methanoregulaceae archaeon]
MIWFESGLPERLLGGYLKYPVEPGQVRNWKGSRFLWVLEIESLMCWLHLEYQFPVLLEALHNPRRLLR